MEKLILKREVSGLVHTRGELWHNDQFICYTLEDPVRKVKIKNKTAIPNGTYEIIITPSPRFGLKMPRLINVPLFSGILIHKGNTAEDSSGCILVGAEKNEKGLLKSTVAYIKVYNLIEGFLKKGKVFIEIINKTEEVKEVEKPKLILSEKKEEIITTQPSTEKVENNKVDLSSKLKEQTIQSKQDLLVTKSNITWKNYFLNLWKSILHWFKIHLSHKLTTNQLN